ncbi:MAG: hypothetical protein ACI9R3_001166 [Verrucomicrobiales bacterium]|jgi:hypothetical protein
MTGKITVTEVGDFGDRLECISGEWLGHIALRYWDFPIGLDSKG